VPSNNNWLDPVIVVFCLLVIDLAFSQRLTQPLVYLALLAFIISAPLLYRSDRNRHRPGQTALSRLVEACSRVLARWGAIVGALLFIAYAFDLGAALSRGMMLTWFVITPIALCLSQAVRLRAR
jgi:putative colanic acid biosysnthesis UDP-glucose lipid carrier transferase